MSERRDQMITYSLFDKLMRNEMPQNQGQLDATLLVEEKNENLINNLASSWVYEKLVTNVGLSDEITGTKIEYSRSTLGSSCLPPTPLHDGLASYFGLRTSSSDTHVTPMTS